MDGEVEGASKEAGKRMNLGDMSSEERVELVKMCGEEVRVFSEVFCTDLVTSGIPDFHDEMYRMVMESDRVLIAAPRGFSKSVLLARIYVLWMAVYGIRRDILVISASEGLAIENLRYVKGSLESNDVLRGVYGEMSSDKWRENHIELSNGVRIRAKGAQGQIRGFRPDCIILDDLETDDSVESAEQRKKLKDWVFRACINCLLPGGQLVMIGTVLSQLSLLNELLVDDNGWSKRRYTAYRDGIQEAGNELWPVLRPHDWLQKRKAEIGSHRFSSEYMNNPVSDEEAPIKVEHIRYWEVLPENLNMVIAVDPAYSEDKKADYKAAALVGIDWNGNRYLVETIRTRVPMGEYIQAILSLWQAYRGRVTAIGLPSTGVEREFFRSITNKAAEMDLYPPFIGMKHTFVTATGGKIRSKVARIKAALQPLFESGKYFIGRDHEEAKEELLTMSNAMHDDLVDCMCYCETLLVPHAFPVDDVGESILNSDYQKSIENDSFCEDYGLVY